MNCKCDICQRSRHCAQVCASGDMAAMSQLIDDLLNTLIETEEELAMLRWHVDDLWKHKPGVEEQSPGIETVQPLNQQMEMSRP